MRHLQPAKIGPTLTARYVLNTSAPEARITLDPFRIVVRRLLARGEHTQPGVWEYRSIERCEVGAPLRITDAGGTPHRLGVVTGIELVSEQPLRYAEGLTGLTRELIDARVLPIQVAGQRTVVLGRRVHIFTARGRELHQAEPGQPLLIAREGSTEVLDLGVVQHCFHLEG